MCYNSVMMLFQIITETEKKKAGGREHSVHKGKKLNGNLSFIISFVFLFLALLLFALARLSKGFANWHAETIYPLWQGSLGRFSGLFPFSLSELILYSLPFILALVFFINRKALKRAFGFSLLLVSLLLFLYQANCGVNYYRDSFVEVEGIEVGETFSQEDLYDFCIFAIEGIKENSGGYPQGQELAAEARKAMVNLSYTYPSLQGYYPVPKALVNSRPFSKMGVTGIYSPFTIEANYNREIPGYDRPFTACHELSHLRGYMDEGEANFIGWLACLNSENKAFRRSAYMLAWIYGGNALNKEDPVLRNSIRNTIPQDALDEFKAANEFWATHETQASEVQDKINDAYLKSNGLKEGIKSYNKVLYMMLSWYKNQQ